MPQSFQAWRRTYGQSGSKLVTFVIQLIGWRLFQGSCLRARSLHPCRLVRLGPRLAALLVAVLVLGPLRASAAPPRPPPPDGKLHVAPKISYEQQRTNRVLFSEKLAPEPGPEGKRIAFIRVVRDDVYVPDEIWPLWWNWFHGRTREYVIRRELLFETGKPYVTARIEETMRNLRGMGIFAVVRIVAVQTGKPGEVGVLVHTRDLWSLRPETNFNITRGVINSFLLRGTEINAFGRNKAPSVEYLLTPKSYELAQGYEARRVWLSSVALKERAGLVFNRGRDRLEGGNVALSVGQPFYRLSQRFAWTASFLHDKRIVRALSNGETLLFAGPGSGPEGPFANWAYRRRYQYGYAKVTWREGEAVKHAVNLGWDYRGLRTWVIRETELPEQLRADFVRRAMPQNRRDSGPTLSYEFFVPQWVTFVNLATYGLSENVRVGPYALASTRVPLRAMGSSANAWVISGEAGIVLAPKGFLIDIKAAGVARLQKQRWIDQRALLQLRGASPVFSVFRLVMRSYVELRRHDSQNTLVSLGADNGLRGYSSAADPKAGADRFLTNIELRTLPLEWQAVHVGAVLFYDVGAVFKRADQVIPQHSVGVGVRILFPQINRTPFTVDGGMSFTPFHFEPSVSAGQPVPLTAAEDLD